MTRRSGIELAKALQLIERHILIAQQIERGIEEHRAMAGGEHETIAIRPVGGGRVEFQNAGEQNRRHIGEAHGQAGVAGLRLLYGVHGQCANRIGHVIMCDVIDHHCGWVASAECVKALAAPFEEAPHIALGNSESNRVPVRCGQRLTVASAH
jgi:hypothetical protein